MICLGHIFITILSFAVSMFVLEDYQYLYTLNKGKTKVTYIYVVDLSNDLVEVCDRTKQIRKLEVYVKATVWNTYFCLISLLVCY